MNRAPVNPGGVASRGAGNCATSHDAPAPGTAQHRHGAPVTQLTYR